MPKDQNITLEYGTVKFETPLVNFLELVLRVNLPTGQQAGMKFVQEYMNVLVNNTDVNISYNAKRSTYGRDQHLNVYEIFTVEITGKPRFAFYSEYADDPHHKIDLSRDHQPVPDPTTLMQAILSNRNVGPVAKIAEKLMMLANRVTLVQNDNTIVGFWFDHDNGTSMIGLNLTAYK